MEKDNPSSLPPPTPPSRAAGASSDTPSLGSAMTWLAAGLLLLPWLIWTLRRCMGLDFWYDEIYTLDNFVFVPLRTTLTDYSQPNNHVLFNLLNNLWTHALGVQDTFDAMDTPWIMRILPLLYSLATLAVTFLATRRCAGALAGLFAVLILATTVPFLNFAVQVRGYSLSMLLLTTMVCWLWCWEDRHRRAYLVAAGLAGALAIYAIPSNLYAVLSIGAFYVLAAARQFVRPAGPAPSTSPRRHLAAALAPAMAVAVAVCLYAPMLRDVLANSTLQSGRPFNTAVLTTLLPRILWYFLSARVLLVLLPVGALLAGLLMRHKPARTILWQRWMLCACLLLLPPLASWVRGDQPPDRIFVNVVPIFALWLAISAAILWQLRPLRSSLAWTLLLVAAAYCYTTFGLALHQVDRHLLTDIQQARKSQDAFYAYYLAYFAPWQAVHQLLACQAVQPGAICVYDYGDKAAVYRHLQKAQLPAFSITDVKEIQVDPGGVWYVLTAWPERCRLQIAQSCPQLDCRLLTPQPSFYGLLECRQR